MATNNSDTSFLDNAKEYAGNVASNAYTQTKNEFSRVSQNSKDRDWIVDRENKLNNLTSSQKEQLKYISSADDAMKFVETATSGDSEGAEKLYNQALKSQGGAILSFAGDVATTALGGAAGKAAIKAAPKLFKGVAEVIGENVPSLKKYGNIFKSSADRADEALAAERTGRAAAREQRAQESIQRAQTEQQQARTARNSTQNSETPFISNTTRATEAIEETVTPQPQQSIFGKVADWTKDKIVQGADWTGGKVVEGVKSVGSGIASLGKTTLKGASLGAAIGIPAGEYYDSLSDEEKASWQEKAQKGVDWVDNAIDHPGEAWEDVKKGAGDLLGDAGSAALGAIVGKGSNPFKGISAGMGSLFAGGGSIGSTLNSMPSGGDSGITGEGHFGGDNIQGTSAIEVLNKIYNILAKTYDTVNTISRDVSTLTRSQSQQNAANDINSVNMQARQNEMGMATATPMYGGGGSSIQSGGGEEDNKEGGIWSKIFNAGKKIDPKAAGAAAAAVVNPGKKVKLLKKLWDTGKKVAGAAKTAAPIAARVGGAAIGAKLLTDEEFKEQGITDPYAMEAIRAKTVAESGGKGGGEGDWTKTSNSRIREKMPQLKGMSDDELNSLKEKGNEAFLDVAYKNVGGYKWRGRGLTQLTGKSNYEAADKALGLNGALIDNPDILATDKDLDRKVSVWFYKNAGGDKKTFSSQEEANKWAIKAAGGKKYAPGTDLGNKELEKVNKIQQSSKTMVASREEKTPEVDNSSQKSNIPESMEAFRTELLEHKEKQKTAEKEYDKIKNESIDSPDYLQRLSDAEYKLTNIRNSQTGILFDEKYKDSKDFIDEHDTSIKSYDNFINDPDYLKKKGFSATTKTVSGGGVTTKTASEYVKTDLDKAGEAHEQDPLNNPDPLVSVHSKIKPQGYLESKDSDLEKRRTEVEADMKANRITTDEANAKYDDINREQNNNEWDKMQKADAATASPKTATPYSDVPDSEKLDAPKFLLYKDSIGTMQKQDLETGEEFLATDEDIAQDKAQKELEAKWVEKHKTTAQIEPKTDPLSYTVETPGENSKVTTTKGSSSKSPARFMNASETTTVTTTGGGSTLHVQEQSEEEKSKLLKEEAHQRELEKKYEGVYQTDSVKASKNPTASPLINTAYNPDSETPNTFSTAQFPTNEPKPLGYTLSDDHEGGKNKIDIQTRKKTKATPEEIKQFYGDGPVLSDEELKQKYKENPNFNTDDLRKTSAQLEPKPTGSSQLQKGADKPTASPLSKKEQDMLTEVNDLNAQETKLKAERDAEPSYKNYGDDKESMDKDLNKLSENYTKQHELDDKRNAIIGTPEYLEARKKQKGQSGQSQAPARQQQPQQARPQQQTQQNERSSPAGTTKSAPAVRNDDPTIKMMEEGSMWSTNGGLMS